MSVVGEVTSAHLLTIHIARVRTDLKRAIDVT